MEGGGEMEKGGKGEGEEKKGKRKFEYGCALVGFFQWVAK